MLSLSLAVTTLLIVSEGFSPPIVRRIMSDCPCADAAALATDDEASLVGLGTREVPRVAGSAASARVLLDAWRADPDIAAARAAGVEIVSEAATHPCEGEEVACHGRVAYPRETAAGAAPASGRPGVIVVHTAVGPHDLYVHWRLESLAALG